MKQEKKVKISLYVNRRQLEVIKMILPLLKDKNISMSDFYREGADEIIKSCYNTLKNINNENNTKGEN